MSINGRPLKTRLVPACFTEARQPVFLCFPPPSAQNKIFFCAICGYLKRCCSIKRAFYAQINFYLYYDGQTWHIEQLE
jgi:hypothetical protein